MLRRSVWILTFAIGCAASTAPAPGTCRERAEDEFRRCNNPMFVNQGQQPNLTTSDEAQRCRESYQQSLEACGETGPGLTNTSTISPIPDVN